MILALAGCPTVSEPGGGGSGISLGNILSGGQPGGTAGPSGATSGNSSANPTGSAAPPPAPSPEDGGSGGGGQGATMDSSSGGSTSSSEEGPVDSGGSGGGAAAGMGTIPDTPITVVGNPMPMTPMDNCRTPCEPSFQDMQMVVAAGDSPSVQVRGFLRCTEPSSVKPIGLRMVSILDPLFPPEPKGYATANILGCFTVNLQAPAGRTVQFRASHCLHTFETDLVIPQTTEQQTLEPCPFPEEADDAPASESKVKVFLKKSFSK